MNGHNFNKIKSYLRKNLSKDRFFHSLETAKAAKKIARLHKGINPEKAYLAGLVHDIARDLEPKKLIAFAKKHRIKIDAFNKKHPTLLHTVVGAKMAKKLFKIRDKEILQAIEKHAVPKIYMNLLDKILYLADVIAPTPKVWAGLKETWKKLKISIDSALLYTYNENIKHFIKKDFTIHPDLIKARNKLLENLNKKVLILGGKGMLGFHLKQEFKECNLTSWDKEDLDVTNRVSLTKKLTHLKPDLIINAAAYTDVEKAESQEKKALRVNGKAVGYLAQIASKINAVLVQYSTDYVFDGKARRGYKETAQPNPLNVYGKSKFLGEALLRRNTDKYYLIRSSWMFGQGKNNFVQKMLQLEKRGAKLTVVNDQWGKPTFARDLACRTRELLEQEKPFGIYHITNEGKTTWYQFARKIFELSKNNPDLKPVNSQDYKTEAKRPVCSVLLNTKLSKLRHWEEALAEYLEEIF